METGLTPRTDQTIINLAHAFDGYAYAKQALHTSDEGFHEILGKRMLEVKESGKLFLSASDNFATNYYLHRNFHHCGWLPGAKSPEWYIMLFFYLHLYRIPVPAAYRHASAYGEWARRPKGAAEAAATEIRQVLSRGA